jgi:hypothetical protein
MRGLGGQRADVDAPSSPEFADSPTSATVRIGVTGHLNLTPDTVRLVEAELRRRLLRMRGEGDARSRSLVGVSCLARGADSVFAQVLVELGGRLEVIIPSADYRDREVGPDHAPIFDALLEAADDVRIMPCPTAEPAAYVVANNAMLDTIDGLFAVWDGGLLSEDGGTAHVVKAARARRIPVTVIWPDGARRE